MLDLIFPRRGRRAVLLCDGPRPSTELIARCLRGADCFVCADAAGLPYSRLPRPPDLVIGDFDTLGRETPREPKIRYLHLPDQESSDSEKALAQLTLEGFAEALILGATGGRLDHSLFNVLLLERFASRLRLCLVDEDAATLRVGAGSETLWPLPVDTRFSLLPLAGLAAGVSLRGARYPLQNETIASERLNTLSNRVASSPLGIRIRSGALLLSVALERSVELDKARDP